MLIFIQVHDKYNKKYTDIVRVRKVHETYGNK